MVRSLSLSRARSLARARSQTTPGTTQGVVVAGRANFVHVRLDSDAVSTGAAASERPGLAASDAASLLPLASRVSSDAPELLCTKRSLLKKMGQSVLVGDRVEVSSIDWAHMRGVVAAVAPRTTESSDPPVANADHMLLVFALVRPELDFAQVSRFLVADQSSPHHVAGPVLLR